MAEEYSIEWIYYILYMFVSDGLLGFHLLAVENNAALSVHDSQTI